MLVERQIRHQPLQARILVAQLAHLPQLAHPELAVLLFPDVERGLRHPQLPADIADRGTAVRLAQRVRDLLLRKLRLLHRLLLDSEGAMKAAYLYL